MGEHPKLKAGALAVVSALTAGGLQLTGAPRGLGYIFYALAGGILVWIGLWSAHSWLYARDKLPVDSKEQLRELHRRGIQLHNQHCVSNFPGSDFMRFNMFHERGRAEIIAWCAQVRASVIQHAPERHLGEFSPHTRWGATPGIDEVCRHLQADLDALAEIIKTL